MGHTQNRQRAGIACSHYVPLGVPGFENGAIITGGYDNIALLWNTKEEQPYGKIEADGAVLCITHTNDGRIILGTDKGYGEIHEISFFNITLL